MRGEVFKDTRLKKYEKNFVNILYTILFFITKLLLDISIIGLAIIGIVSLIYPQTRNPLFEILKEAYFNLNKLLIV